MFDRDFFFEIVRLWLEIHKVETGGRDSGKSG